MTEGSGRCWSGVLDLAALTRWGERLGRSATTPGPGPGVTVGLEGPLGAGKTTLVRAACRGAGVRGPVRSPTFTLHNHHRPLGRRPIHHLDLYRLESEDELDGLGWDDLMGSAGVVFVEWADRAGVRLPGDRWEIRMDFADAIDRRRVELRARGPVPGPPLPESGVRARRPPRDASQGDGGC